MSAMPEYSTNLNHHIQLYSTGIVAKKCRRTYQITTYGTQIERHPNNMNMEDGFSPSRLLKLLICTLKA
jgi:hypothetical protein